jgi:hypothetical protein
MNDQNQIEFAMAPVEFSKESIALLTAAICVAGLFIIIAARVARPN